MLGRMVMNVAVDTLVGVIPIAGDLFDVAWKANTRNMALLERYLEKPVATRRSSRLMVFAMIGAFALLAAGGITLAVVTVKWLVGLLR